MKALFLFCLSLLLISIPINAQEPYTQWLRNFGNFQGNDEGNSVQQTHDGNYIIVGASGDSYQDWGLALYKRDSLGNPIWHKIYGGPGYEFGNSLQITNEGGYIIAGKKASFINGYNDNLWLLKTNSMGDTLWTRIYGGSGWDWGESVQLTTDGGYIVVGSTDSFSDDRAIWLLKTDSLGHTIWSKTFSGEWANFGYSVQQTLDGGYIIVGTKGKYYWRNGWVIKTNSSGDTLWTKTYGNQYLSDYFNDVILSSDSSYVVLGSKSNGGAIWLLKLNEIGDTIWTKTYGGGYGTSIKQTSDGGYIICSLDMRILKTNTSGELEWSKTLGLQGGNIGSEVQQTLDGGYIVTGNSGVGQQYQDIILIKLGSTEIPNISVLYPNSRAKWILGTTVEILYWTTENILNVKIDLSLDNGDSWSNIVNSTPNSGTYSWLVIPDSISSECLIRVSDVANNEVFDVSDTTFIIDSLVVGINSINNEILVNFALHQNYPNPFNPTTTIKYQIPEISFATIKIFDVLGNEIATLINEEKPAGEYEIEFNAEDLTNGIYFYQFRAGNFVETKKMVLIK